MFIPESRVISNYRHMFCLGEHNGLLNSFLDIHSYPLLANFHQYHRVSYGEDSNGWDANWDFEVVLYLKIISEFSLFTQKFNSKILVAFPKNRIEIRTTDAKCYSSSSRSRTATDMDGSLHTDLWKSETSREIKKNIWTSSKVVLIFKIRRVRLKI